MHALRILVALLVVGASVPVAAVDDGNEPPLVDAGLDQEVDRDATVYLDGTGSRDPDGELTNWNWRIETPDGRTVTPSDPSAPRTQFEPTGVGEYAVTLTVTDDDGATRSDTLYVQVGTAAGEQNPATSTPSGDTTPEEVNEPTQPGEASGGESTVDTNEGPNGEILGPDEVQSGASATYEIVASDPDGRVVGHEWLKAPSVGSGSLTGWDRNADQLTYTFDVPPGRTVVIPATVVDDDGAEIRVAKTVRVVENAPTATLLGPSEVETGSTHAYEVVTSGFDGNANYEWSTVSNSGRADATLTSANGDSKEWVTFSGGNDTVTLRVTVEGEAGSATAKKDVSVVSRGWDVPAPAAGSAPKINSISIRSPSTASFSGALSRIPAEFVYSVTAEDTDGETLTYSWSFGDGGSATTTAQSGTPSKVRYSYPGLPDDTVGAKPTYEVTVTVTDQNGNSDTVTKTLSFEPTASVAPSPEAELTLERNEITVGESVEGTVSLTDHESDASLRMRYGDGTIESLGGGRVSQNEVGFEHSYDTVGEYTIYVVGSGGARLTGGHSSVTVTGDSSTYTEWHWVERVTRTHEQYAKTKPGDDWTRGDDEKQILRRMGTKRQEVRSRGRHGSMTPGSEWNHVGATLKTETVTESRVAAEKPGPDWTLVERSVDTKRKQVGWQTITVRSRRLAQDSWEYLGTKSTEKTVTQTKYGHSEPSGSGWTRNGKTGDRVRTGSERVWVDSRYLAESSWDYVRSKRVLTGYSSYEVCTEKGWIWGQRVCTNYETRYEANYDYKYLYERPTYGAVYEWTRTRTKTEYVYEYRYPVYDEVDLHEFERSREVTRMYDIYEKPIIEKTTLFEWRRTTKVERERSGTSPPTTNYVEGSIEKHQHECPKGDSSNNHCSGE